MNTASSRVCTRAILYSPFAKCCVNARHSILSRHSITTERLRTAIHRRHLLLFSERCVTDEPVALCPTTAELDPTRNASRAFILDRATVSRW